jgi:hypothetical protein
VRRSRRHFIIDASALTPLFVLRKGKPGDIKCRTAMLKLIKLRDNKAVDLYVPNFCMAECAKAFARELALKAKDTDSFHEQLHQHKELLLDTVSRKRKGIIQSIGLKRKHLEGIEDVFTAEHKTDRRSEGGSLSGLDALIIAIGRFHVGVYGYDNVWIVTADEWLAAVCNRSEGMFPRAVYVLKQAIPDG